jgi:hypothetical protein
MIIGFNTITKIEEEREEFYSLFEEHVRQIFAHGGLEPVLQKQRLADIHYSWGRDMTRVGAKEPKLIHGLDHFKRLGHLVFWLRRFSPVIGANETIQDNDLDEKQKKFRKIFVNYSNEYPAFDLGFQFCNLYYTVRSGNSSTAAVELEPNFVEDMCYFLKYKSVSPHAIAMIYRSIFETR